MKKTIIGFILGSVVFGTAGVFAGQYAVTPNPFPIKLDGENVEIEGYNINDTTYFKLRDIASVVGGFNVDFKDDTILLSKQEADAQELSKQKEIFTSYYDNELVEKYGLTDRSKIRDNGLVANYIDDYDNDGCNEMAVIVGKPSNEELGYEMSCFYLQMYEIENDNVVMSGERSMFLNHTIYFLENVFFVHEYEGKKYICSTACATGVNGNLYTNHKLFSYDGSRLVCNLSLDDPGYTSGMAIDCVYNDDESTLHDCYGEMLNSGVSYKNEYELYQAVIAKEGERYGLEITTYGDWKNEFNDGAVEKSLPMYTSDNSKIIAKISERSTFGDNENAESYRNISIRHIKANIWDDVYKNGFSEWTAAGHKFKIDSYELAPPHVSDNFYIDEKFIDKNIMDLYIDGQYAYYSVDGDGWNAIYKIDLDTLEKKELIKTNEDHSISAMNGKYLYADGDFTSDVKIYDLEKEKVIKSIPDAMLQYECVSTGGKIRYTAPDVQGKITLYEAEADGSNPVEAVEEY